MRFPLLLGSLVLAGLACFVAPTSARADGDAAPDPSKDPQVARLLQAKQTLHWNVNINGARYGHAETLVEAPAEKCAKRAQEFGKYKELHRKFAGARVINKEGDKTDVYMKYPVIIGPVKIDMYEVMRFNPDHVGAQPGSHVIEAYGIKGDMKRGHTIITVKPVDANHALVEIDVLLVPTLPAPQSYVDEELRDGAYDFVSGLRDHTQPTAGPVTAL